MSVLKGKIRLVGAPPGSGKSAVREMLATQLRVASGRSWVVLEHEDIFSPQMRANAMKYAQNMVMEFNLPGQLAFQNTLRRIADQGVSVVGLGPFENVYSEVAGMPLYQKMVSQDYLGYDFKLAYFLLTGSSPTEVEEEIQRRLAGRANKSPWQEILDGDKVGRADYYESRACHVRRSAEQFNLPLIEYPIGGQVEELAIRLADAILRS